MKAWISEGSWVSVIGGESLYLLARRSAGRLGVVGIPSVWLRRS